MSGMVKLFSPGDWSDGGNTEDVQIKVASGGLGFADKLAAKKQNISEEILHWLGNMETHPDCLYVHKVAMSGSDRYGPNRWGDGFTDATLQRDVPTFEQHAKAYRNHKSKNAPFFGRPKLARFRDPLGVVELVTEYYGSDKVASANGGLIADKELDVFYKRGSIPVSMGSHVPGDRCVTCGHWAKSRKEHCLSKAEGGNCNMFGCRNGILKIASDGRQQFVDNPFNCFYDISAVFQGADPVANGLVLPVGMFDPGNESKVASFADGLAGEPSQSVLDYAVVPAAARTAMSLVYHWSDIESKIAAGSITAEPGLHCEVNDLLLSGIDSSVRRLRHQTIQKLASRNIFPTFEQYAKTAGMSDAVIRTTRKHVPMAYTSLIRSGQVNRVLGEIPTGKYASTPAVPCSQTLSRWDTQQRTLQANAECRRFIRSDFSLEPIPELVAKYASAKIEWALMHPNLDTWSLAALPWRDAFEESTIER